MAFEGLIVGIVILAAVVFAGRSLLRKRHAFSTKGGCGADCGCNGKPK